MPRRTFALAIAVLAVTPVAPAAAAPQTWTDVTTPDLADTLTLRDVAATGPRDAWAVGADKNQTTPVILHWNGRTWTRRQAPAGTSPWLRTVTAADARNVWAFGVRNPTNSPGAALSLHWNGRTWRTLPYPDDMHPMAAAAPPHRPAIPEPTGPYATLADDGRGGVWVSGPGNGRTVYQHFGEGTWTTSYGPDRLGVQTSTNALASIPGTRSVWSVGDLNGTAPFIERLR